LRLTALNVLAHLGGESALDRTDIAAVERLVRVRRRTDALASVSSCWTKWWAVRSDDPVAVMATLGLTNPRPVTYALAQSVVEIMEHGDRQRGLVYVGPAVNGWTTLVGHWCDAFGDRAAEVRATLERLSAEFGEAHAFYYGDQGDGSAWLVARDGRTVRRYSTINPDDACGDPLPIEQDWLDAHGVPGRPEDHLYSDDEYEDAVWDFPDAPEIAAVISVAVGWPLPTDARIQGGPLLATVPGRAAVTLPPGMYEI
jgi:hypothetical protein